MLTDWSEIRRLPAEMLSDKLCIGVEVPSSPYFGKTLYQVVKVCGAEPLVRDRAWSSWVSK